MFQICGTLIFHAHTTQPITTENCEMFATRVFELEKMFTTVLLLLQMVYIGVEMEELMQNKEFLESVLSTLPGVNPEQALRNLREMTEASTSAQAQGQRGDRKEEEEDEEAMEQDKVETKVSSVGS